LIVDADRMHSGEITLQRFESIAGGRGEVRQSLGIVQLNQFPARHLEEVGWESLGLPPLGKNGFGELALETSDHDRLFNRRMYHIVIRQARLLSIPSGAVQIGAATAGVSPRLRWPGRVLRGRRNKTRRENEKVLPENEVSDSARGDTRFTAAPRCRRSAHRN
jgi:hypothetical protein